MGFQARNSYPGGGRGYWRGSDILAAGSGSGMGQANQGAGVLSQGLGGVGSMSGGWEPSVLYLLGFVVVEMIAFHLIGRMLK